MRNKPLSFKAYPYERMQPVKHDGKLLFVVCPCVDGGFRIYDIDGELIEEDFVNKVTEFRIQTVTSKLLQSRNK